VGGDLRAEVLRAVRSPERAQTDQLLSALRWVSVDEPVGRRTGGLGRQYRRSHPGLSIVAFVAAASAQLLDAELATANIHLYPVFPGLAPPYEH
jgi:predicted nucleic acid-binding protein